MRHIKNKQLVLLLGIIFPTVWCGANDITLFDGYSHIIIKEGILQGFPKGSTINATISGHLLTVSFTQNIGQVEVEITTEAGSTVDYLTTMTPTGFQCYISNAGDYIVTFTLANGDEYYGEFTVTD